MSKNFIVQSVAAPLTYTPLASKPTAFHGAIVTPASCDIYAKATEASWLSAGFTPDADVLLPSSFAVDVKSGNLATLLLKSATGEKIQLIGETVDLGLT
jgi:hypothetical protein